MALNVNQLPTHTHSLNANTNVGNNPDPAGASLADTKGSDKDYMKSGEVNTAMSAQSIGSTGGGQPHENRQPYLAVNYIIALQGIFPSRN